MKIIIWGYPLHSHTHSYIHASWYKSFKSLNYETYWFNDQDYPKNFDYSNSLFITEGYAEKNIPLNKSSTYFVHICINPEKYIKESCRLIDIRFNVNEINDCNYSMILDKSKLIKIDSCSFYDPAANDSVLSDQFKKNIDGYEAIYMSWATDLLPNEFDFNDIDIERENKIYWVGSISESNQKEIKIFIDSLKGKNISFIHSDPWSNPISNEHLKYYVQKSFIAPDIRGSANRKIVNGKIDTGSNHKLIGYIPCRIFKNISYGQIGITNSKSVYNLFEGNIIYSDNEGELLELSFPHVKDKKTIKSQMEFVKNNHTFINRINSIMRVKNREI